MDWGNDNDVRNSLRTINRNSWLGNVTGRCLAPTSFLLEVRDRNVTYYFVTTWAKFYFHIILDDVASIFQSIYLFSKTIDWLAFFKKKPKILS